MQYYLFCVQRYRRELFRPTNMFVCPKKAAGGSYIAYGLSKLICWMLLLLLLCLRENTRANFSGINGWFSLLLCFGSRAEETGVFRPAPDDSHEQPKQHYEAPECIRVAVNDSRIYRSTAQSAAHRRLYIRERVRRRVPLRIFLHSHQPEPKRAAGPGQHSPAAVAFLHKSDCLPLGSLSPTRTLKGPVMGMINGTRKMGEAGRD